MEKCKKRGEWRNRRRGRGGGGWRNRRRGGNGEIGEEGGMEK